LQAATQLQNTQTKKGDNSGAPRATSANLALGFVSMNPGLFGLSDLLPSIFSGTFSVYGLL
jgi:hypothetical protein